jgi:photosystem II stability/assembly factor-like uncharacterized protein
MKRSRIFSFLALSALLITTGQGCLFFGGDRVSDTSGGIWQTEDAGVSWFRMNVLPQASGTGSIGGVNVVSFEMDPGDSSAYYIGTRENGMFTSTDAAQTWERPEDTRLREGTVLDIEVDPRDVCTIYALRTRELLKTTDCGRTWDDVYTETQTNITLSSMSLDWFNPDVLWLGSTDGDLLRTADGGATWALAFLFPEAINDVLVGNSDSRTVFVGTAGSSFYRTGDAGENWTIFRKDLDIDDTRYVRSFDQTADGNTVLALVESGVIISGDAGVTWDRLPLVSAAGDALVTSVAVHPHNDQLIAYATPNAFYQSDSRGAAWKAEEFPGERAANIMTIHPDLDQRVIIGLATLLDD